MIPAWAQTALFGIACAAALCLALMTARRRGNADATFLAILFAGTFATSNYVFYALGSTAAHEFQVVEDLTAAFVAFILLHERCEDWKLWIVWLAALKMIATFIFWWEGGPALGPHGAYTYGLILQAGFALQLACVMLAGVHGVGARILGRRTRRGAQPALAQPAATRIEATK